MPSFCAQCSTVLEPDARFCEECGAQVDGKASKEDLMKSDAFTRVLLVIIAVFLGIIALRPFFQSEATVSNSVSHDYIRPVAGFMGASILLDTRNGDLWLYDFDKFQLGGYGGRLVELGKPIQRK